MGAKRTICQARLRAPLLGAARSAARAAAGRLAAGLLAAGALAAASGCGGGGAATAAVEIVTQPVDQSVVEGSSATFTVAARNAVGYQWQRSTDGGATWSDLAGAVSASYTTPPATLAESGQRFRVAVSGPDRSVTSSAATLTVTAAAVAATVIFSSGANLYAVADDGTGPVILATSNRYRGVTPNRRVVYEVMTASLDLASVGLDGTGAAVLAATADPESFKGITPSGRVIYKRVTGGQSDLYGVNDDGTGTALLAGSPDLEDFSSTPFPPYSDLTWGITASGKVVYSRSPVGGGPADVYIVGADGTGTVALANTANHESFPVNLPGGRVAFTSGPWLGTPTSTVLVGEDGTGAVTLPSTLGSVVACEGGRVVTRGYPNVATVALYSLTPLGGDVVTLASGPYNNLDELFFDGVAGGRVFYHRRLRSDLYAVPVLGGTPVTLVDGATTTGAFAGVTSGGRVVYADGDLHAIDPDGTGRVDLAATADDERYRASTADGKVIYESNPPGLGAHDLHLVGEDGTGRVDLAVTADDEVFAGLSPSGRIVFQRNVGGAMHLYSVRPDGTGEVVLHAGASTFHAVF